MDIVALVKGLTTAVIPIIVAITFHEAAHGWVANKCGDSTAKDMGRLTLNPVPHIDLVWTLIVPVLLFIVNKGAFTFGMAKPVPVNFGNLRHPRRDSALVAAAGPVMNILLAAISFIVYLLLFDSPKPHSAQMSFVAVPLSKMLEYSILFNIFLASFNLLPFPPLDGGRIVVSMLPARQAYQFSKIEPYGIIIVLVLWFTGVAHYIINPIERLVKLIIGLILLPFGGLM